VTKNRDIMRISQKFASKLNKSARTYYSFVITIAKVASINESATLIM